jgi:hypothetical protein
MLLILREQVLMRPLKLSVLCLFCLAVSLPICQKFFPGFLVHGQTVVSISAPTNLAASDNTYSTKIGLTWEAVRGAALYRIFRNTTNDSTTAVVLGTTVEGSFFDPTAVVGQAYFFWVRGENGTVVSGLSQPDQGTRANGLTNFGPVPPLNPPPAPPGNPVTAAKAFLGKTLFGMNNFRQRVQSPAAPATSQPVAVPIRARATLRVRAIPALMECLILPTTSSRHPECQAATSMVLTTGRQFTVLPNR